MKMNHLKKFPDRASLLESQGGADGRIPLKVNNHIHTPYSFSAFRDIDEAVRMAKLEDIRVLGINDFYVTDGYGEFIRKCLLNHLFPLLNIELIGISKREQEDGIRINDPGNPGRIYICGKGLAHPPILPAKQQQKLDQIINRSNSQVTEMIRLLNQWMKHQQLDMTLSTGEVMQGVSGKLLRERHVARALRLKLEDHVGSKEAFNRLLQKLYGGKEADRQREDIAGTEDEMRARLLKSGAPAFVPEDGNAFLSINEIMSIIRDAGGIPTYPMLLDGTGGAMTGFERNKTELADSLKKMGFDSVELIPHRNGFEMVKEYASYFYAEGYMVSFGTEHNTSAMSPLTVSCRGEEPLDEELMQISYNGAACVAAHQYMTAREGKAYEPIDRLEMEKLGHAVFQHYFSPGKPIK